MSDPDPPEDYTYPYPEDYVPPPPFPSLVSSMTLHVTKGTPPNEVTYTESIPYASFGENSFPITNQQLIDDFSNKPPGTTYSYYITTNYVPGSLQTGDTLTTPTVTNQTVKAIPSLYTTSITYNPVTEECFVSQCSSTNSSGSLTYTTGDENVCKVENGKLIAVGTGITDLVCSQTGNSEYEGGTTSATVIVTYSRSTTPEVRVVPLVLHPNGITIIYTGRPDIITPSIPLFIPPADIRRTGTPERFAIVNDTHRLLISNYARGLSAPFTPEGESQPVPFNNIVTTNMTFMDNLFQDATLFNGEISSWDTSRVMTMVNMFNNATAFDQPLNSWNTSSVFDMRGMFANARAFNRPLDNWNTSRVSNMASMFNGASVFDQNIGAWDTSHVVRMIDMFNGANMFNQSLNSWNTSNVIDMRGMFRNAIRFNQPLNSWNTSRVINMSFMFQGATSFNNGSTPGLQAPLIRWVWNVSNIISGGLDFMFNGAIGFNANISNWDVRITANGFRLGSPLIDQFTPLAIRNST
jgi:surface protein